MSDVNDDVASKCDILILTARIRELEARLVGMLDAARSEAANTNNCDLCGTACTYCEGDHFREVLLPGELTRLSGGELVKMLQAGRSAGR